jgi:transcriptional regulator with XRE-family HTH domain
MMPGSAIVRRPDAPRHAQAHWPPEERSVGIPNGDLSEIFQGLLLRHRARSGLTQRQLASRVGMSMRSIDDWEAGVNYPGVERLQTLIAAFQETSSLAAKHSSLRPCGPRYCVRRRGGVPSGQGRGATRTPTEQPVGWVPGPGEETASRRFRHDQHGGGF